MLKSIITFLKLPQSIKFLALEIALELTVACIKLKKYEFKVIAQKLGESGAKQKEFLPQSFENLPYIKSLVERISRLFPWKCQCFAQAIAAQRILMKKNIPSTLFLGLKKDSELMSAHAWLCSGNYIVTGDNGIENYTIINTFSHKA